MKDLISELIERLKSADKDITEALASGSNIHNFDDYQRILGNREGIQQAQAILDSLLREDSENDEWKP
jgi:hypothetical protein